jgi:hypothetical protein
MFATMSSGVTVISKTRCTKVSHERTNHYPARCSNSCIHDGESLVAGHKHTGKNFTGSNSNGGGSTNGDTT